jgi:hypothetical protein
MSILSTSGAASAHRRWRTAVLAAYVVFLLVLAGLFAFRFALWRNHPNLRWILRPLILADPRLERAGKTEIRALLGSPDVVEGRYCWFSRDLHQKTGDLRFEIGDSNQVTRVHFLWGEWKPTRELPMDLRSWKDQSEVDRWAMNADLVRRWPSSGFGGKIESVTDVLTHFPGAVFIDYWQFASDGGRGLGGSIDFEFEPDGRIRKARCGYID